MVLDVPARYSMKVHNAIFDGDVYLVVAARCEHRWLHKEKVMLDGVRFSARNRRTGKWVTPWVECETPYTILVG